MSKIIQKYKELPLTLKASMWFLFCTLIQKVISFVTVPIFTRLMTEEEYGLFNNYLSWETIFAAICTLNMHSVIFVNNYTKADPEEKENVAIPLLSLSFFITICLFILYCIFHNYLDNKIGMPFSMTCLLFIQILFEPAINFWNMKQRFDYQYIFMVIRTIVMVILNTTLGLIFVKYSNGNGAIARAYSIVLVQIIFGVYTYIYFIIHAKKIFSIKGWQHALKIELPLLPHSLSLVVLSSSDRIMISKLVSLAKAGIYSVAYSAGYIVNVLKNSIIDAIKPWMYRKLKMKDYKSIKKYVNFVLIFVIFITISFSLFAPEIIKIMAPSNYYEAIYVIPPVAASSFFTFLYNIFSIVGMYYEKTKSIMIASVSGALLNIILNIIFIPLFGYIAAAFTTLFCYIFFSIAHYVIMKKVMNENDIVTEIYDIKFIIVLSIVIIMLSIIFEFLYSVNIIRYFVIITLLIISIIKRQELMQIIKFVYSKGGEKNETQS